ncbi:MAG: hypothetical protein U5L74_14170 [Ideonella sp.]|nr:hypothetical protein [Ideonella sp.]
MPTTPDSGTPHPSAQPSGSRPSLFTDGGAAQDENQSQVSILSALDAPATAARPKLSQRQLWPWLGGGALAALGLIWLAQSQKTLHEPPVLQASLAAASQVSSASPTASVPVIVTAASASPAIIEVHVASGPVPSDAPASASESIANPDSTSLMVAGGAAAAGAAAATALAAQSATAASAPKKPIKRSKAKADQEVAGAKKAPRASPGRAQAAGLSSSASTDPDVDLIAAVMRHGEAPAGGRSTDDEASTGTSIASMVARCKRLGGSEAKACRQRLCDGYWGKAEACPKRLAPKSSSTAKAAAKPAKPKKKKARPASEEGKT